MICDKCGKSNIAGLDECSYCGAELPPMMCCGGFADVLSINNPTASSGAEHKEMPANEEKRSEKISEVEMQKLFKKTDNIIQSTQKNMLFGLIAIGVGLLILINSFVIIICVRSYKNETMAQIEQTQSELETYKTQIDAVLEEVKKYSVDDATTEETNAENYTEDDTENKSDNSQKEEVSDTTVEEKANKLEK